MFGVQSDPVAVGRLSVSSNLRLRFLAGVGLISCCLVGCGSGAGPSNRDLKVADSLEKGFQAVEGGDWETAERELTIALDSQSLSGDRFEEALIGRARARVRSGNSDGAGTDIAMLERGAAAMDVVLALKAEMLVKKGDVQAAKAAAAEARKINSKIELPKEVK